MLTVWWDRIGRGQMKLKIEISTENAAFEDNSVYSELSLAVSEAIRTACENEHEGIAGIILDSNGNSCGRWKWEE